MAPWVGEELRREQVRRELGLPVWPAERERRLVLWHRYRYERSMQLLPRCYVFESLMRETL